MIPIRKKSLHITPPKGEQQCCGNEFCKATDSVRWSQSIHMGAQRWLCNGCSISVRQDKFCPHCEQIYRQCDRNGFDGKEWVSCVNCTRWTHVECEELNWGKQIRDIQAKIKAGMDVMYLCVECRILDDELRDDFEDLSYLEETEECDAYPPPIVESLGNPSEGVELGGESSLFSSSWQSSSEHEPQYNDRSEEGDVPDRSHNRYSQHYHLRGKNLSSKTRGRSVNQQQYDVEGYGGEMKATVKFSGCRGPFADNGGGVGGSREKYHLTHHQDSSNTINSYGSRCGDDYDGDINGYSVHNYPVPKQDGKTSKQRCFKQHRQLPSSRPKSENRPLAREQQLQIREEGRELPLFKDSSPLQEEGGGYQCSNTVVGSSKTVDNGHCNSSKGGGSGSSSSSSSAATNTTAITTAPFTSKFCEEEISTINHYPTTTPQKNGRGEQRRQSHHNDDTHHHLQEQQQPQRQRESSVDCVVSKHQSKQQAPCDGIESKNHLTHTGIKRETMQHSNNKNSNNNNNKRQRHMQRQEQKQQGIRTTLMSTKKNKVFAFHSRTNLIITRVGREYGAWATIDIVDFPALSRILIFCYCRPPVLPCASCIKLLIACILRMLCCCWSCCCCW